MLKIKENLKNEVEYNNKGDVKLFLSDLAEFDIKTQSFAHLPLHSLSLAKRWSCTGTRMNVNIIT